MILERSWLISNAQIHRDLVFFVSSEYTLTLTRKILERAENIPSGLGSYNRQEGERANGPTLKTRRTFEYLIVFRSSAQDSTLLWRTLIYISYIPPKVNISLVQKLSKDVICILWFWCNNPVASDHLYSILQLPKVNIQQQDWLEGGITIYER